MSRGSILAVLLVLALLVNLLIVRLQGGRLLA